jgi:signal transduction histidine kinase
VAVAADGSVVVEDDGPGIPPDLLPHVFDRLRTTRPGVGTGMGLAIAHELTTAMGGTISVTCPPDGGTRFVVTLPLDRSGGGSGR